MTIGIFKKSGRGMVGRWGVGIMVMVLSVWVMASSVQAKEFTRISKITSIITKMQAIPIPESPGRVIGFYERQGNVQYENGEKAKQILRCTFDMIRGVGPFQGYSYITFEDGSAFLAKIEGVMTKPEKGKLPSGHGTGKFVSGTGKFKGIKGNVSFKATMLKPYGGESKGDAVVEIKGTYTLPD